MPVRPFAAVSLLSILATSAPAAVAPPQADTPGTAPAARLRGFTTKAAAEQRATESRFLEIPRAARAKQFLKILTEDPHPAGTEEGRALADYVRAQLLSFGFDAELVSYEVLLSRPKKVALTLLAPEKYEAKLVEEGVAWDKDSFTTSALPPFHGYAPSGTVTADVVYANYGLPEDYAALEELGIDVRGKLVLVRYGKCYRGVKVREAEIRKAAAVVIYSDPADDGYAKGDVVPRGPWRPETAVQRGSVGFMFLRPGDPLSPGWPARKGARRIEQEAVTGAGNPDAVLPGIPSIPISAADATPILKALAGPNVPEGWQGALPFAYHVGPGPSRVKLQVEIEWTTELVHDVIARWKGVEKPDEWVIVGNHRDAWVHGAVDPNSGTASLLECARALGKLKEAGLKLKRSLVIASWDAEEYGLVGSTEWCEEFATELQAKAIAYLNVDGGVSGRDFGASAAPSLARLVREVSGAVEDPKERRSVLDVWTDRTKPKPARPAAPKSFAGNDGESPPIGNLGSGSDYTAFQHHLGIPSMDVRFSGPYGVYHSVLDDFFWMERFGDPDFTTHRALARWLGVALLRLCQSDLLPHRPTGSAAAFQGHLTELLEKHGESIVAGSEIQKGLDDAKAAVQRLATAAQALESEGDRLVEAADAEGLARVNGRLLRFERELLSKEGLRGRPFYRNVYSAPGERAGYNAVVLPGLTEALEEVPRDERRVVSEATKLAERLGAAANLLEGKTP